MRRTRRVYNTLRAQTRIRIDASLDTDKSLFELTFTTRRTVDRTGGMYAKIHFERRFQEERITERVIQLVNAIFIENQTIIFFYLIPVLHLFLPFFHNVYETIDNKIKTVHH